MTPLPRFAVAPMMDCTDRHCRWFHRRLTREATLYTEMITAEAVLRGDRARLLAYDPSEHPVALQLGGADPARLAAAAKVAADLGYDEINLNVGCPSDRVRSGSFGACLMLKPDLVADCVAAMKGAVAVPVTVKCRLGVDDQDPEEALDTLADKIVAAGTDGIWVHARKAWLQGLSPRENRTVPPLDYDRVRRLKLRLPHVFVGLNGGLADLDQAMAAIAGLDGIMLGRAAYERPGIFAAVDRRFFGAAGQDPDLSAVVASVADYAAAEAARGTPVSRIARHLVGLFHGRPGARAWRRMLSVGAAQAGAGPAVITAALAELGAAEAAIAA